VKHFCCYPSSRRPIRIALPAATTVRSTSLQRCDDASAVCSVLGILHCSSGGCTHSVAHGNFFRAYLCLPIETKCKNDINHFRDFHCEVYSFVNHVAITASKVNWLLKSQIEVWFCPYCLITVYKNVIL
jgi:hypothetical protein